MSNRTSQCDGKRSRPAQRGENRAENRVGYEMQADEMTVTSAAWSDVATGGWRAAMRAKIAGCVYAAFWPVASKTRRRLYPPPRPDEIALTFDDGPNPESTPRLLDLLASHKVKATFFLVGKFAESQSTLVQRMVAEGHTVGNHTWSHPNLQHIPIGKAKDELDQTSRVLEEITGVKVRLFRPPYGACTREVLRIARDLGMLPVFWNAMAEDWEDITVSQIVKELGYQMERNRNRRRATYLVLHDGRADYTGADCRRSVAAVEQLITGAEGRRKFVDIQTWL